MMVSSQQLMGSILQALGKVMGSELPHIPGGSDTVLYPASVKASTDLQDSLAAAGFQVQRINTYNTVRETVMLRLFHMDTE